MRLIKPWKPKEPQSSLSEEDKEIEETKRMIKKTSGIVSINLRLAKLAGPNAVAMLQGQIWGMVEAGIKEAIEKAKAKGEPLTVDTFMAKLDKITGVYDFYAKVSISKDEIRAKAEELIIKGEVEKAEKGGLLNLAPLMAQKMKEGKSSDVAFKEAYQELTSTTEVKHET